MSDILDDTLFSLAAIVSYTLVVIWTVELRAAAIAVLIAYEVSRKRVEALASKKSIISTAWSLLNSIIGTLFVQDIYALISSNFVASASSLDLVSYFIVGFALLIVAALLLGYDLLVDTSIAQTVVFLFSSNYAGQLLTFIVLGGTGVLTQRGMLLLGLAFLWVHLETRIVETGANKRVVEIIGRVMRFLLLRWIASFYESYSIASTPSGSFDMIVYALIWIPLVGALATLALLIDSLDPISNTLLLSTTRSLAFFTALRLRAEVVSWNVDYVLFIIIVSIVWYGCLRARETLAGLFPDLASRLSFRIGLMMLSLVSDVALFLGVQTLADQVNASFSGQARTIDIVIIYAYLFVAAVIVGWAHQTSLVYTQMKQTR